MKQKLIKSMFYAVIILIAATLPSQLVAQERGVRLGDWRVHLPYERCHHLTENQDKIFAASTFGFFSYNKNDGSLERLSSINGFAEGEVSVMEYDPQTDKVWIAYANSKIDVVRKQKITPLNDLFRSTTPGNKTIYHINFANRLAYISTGIGIVVYDQDRMEVRENYLNLQVVAGNNSPAIYATCILRDTLYAATGNGIIYGRISPQINLADFSNWQLLDTSKGSYHLCAFDGKLIAEKDSLLQQWDGSAWSLYFATPVGQVNSVRVHRDKLIVSMDNLVEVREKNNSVHRMQKNGTLMGLVSADEYFWYVTSIDGLVRVNKDSSEFFYRPNGPNTATSFRMQSHNGGFWVTAGSFSPEFIHTYNFSGYNIFKNNEWIRNPYFFTTLRRVHDQTAIAKHPFENKLYVGTHGKGVIEFTGDEPTNWFNRSNSSLQYFDNGAGDSLYYCSGMAFDTEGNLWVSNYGVDSSLHVYTKDKQWKAFRLPTTYAGEMVIDAAQNKWIVMPRPNLSNGALCVFNDNKTPLISEDDTSIILTTQNADLPTNLVRCLALMPNNELWVGTDAGLVVFRNPSNAFGLRSNNPLRAERIIIEQDGVGGFLLGAEVIYSITVDGGGRRWIGTNKGAWLIGKNGQEILANFNKDNSPLPTDNVLTIGVDENSGEVFFGTDKGLFSFKGDASKAESTLQKLKIFPNPVRETFDGDVAIDGLTQDARVKITDINGLVVYETVSNGGRATWNCRTFSGVRPATGVYLVFAIRSDGQESIVGKILFVK